MVDLYLSMLIIATGACSAVEKVLVALLEIRVLRLDLWLSRPPWFLNVGASTIDRKTRASALLGNHEILEGESAFLPMDFPSTFYIPLVCHGSNAKGKM